MKVGTDGVLLGAWAEIPTPAHTPLQALDIGTGSGLIALMLAQRADDMRVTAIDIDADAVLQASTNIAASCFAERITVHHQSLQDFASTSTHFDVIVSNPPFFEEALLPPDERRAQARHATTLPFDTLVSCAAEMLSPCGTFNVILPTPSFEHFHRLCFASGLQLSRRCDVKTVAHKNPKRVLLTYHKVVIPNDDSSTNPTALTGAYARASHTTLVLSDGDGRSAAYRELTHDFYLF